MPSSFASSGRPAPELVARVAELTVETGALLDVELAERRASADLPQPEPSLDTLWTLVTDKMMREADGQTSPDRLGQMIGLLTRIRDAETAQAQLRLHERERIFADVAAALADVSDARTVDSLLARAPEAACRLGFDRSLVSIVDGSWRLHTMCVVRDSGWADEIVAVGREDPPVLDRSLVENDTVEGVRATLVHAVQENPRVNRPLAQITKSTSYGIAPLLVDGDVVGLLHGDCYHQRRVLTEADRTLLAAFADGLSQNLARVTVLDSLAAVRSHLDTLGRWQTPAQNVTASVELSRTDDSVLTRRESQIVRLMAAGDSNARIARRLVITEGTVKTHITRILRKLGASNRAEAVAIWLRSAGQVGVAGR